MRSVVGEPGPMAEPASLEGEGSILGQESAPTASPPQEPQAQGPEPGVADTAHVIPSTEAMAESALDPDVGHDSGAVAPRETKSGTAVPVGAQELATSPPDMGDQSQLLKRPALSEEVKVEDSKVEPTAEIGNPGDSDQSATQSNAGAETGVSALAAGVAASADAGAAAPAPSAGSVSDAEPSASGGAARSMREPSEPASDMGDKASGFALARPSVALASTPGSRTPGKAEVSTAAPSSSVAGALEDAAAEAGGQAGKATTEDASALRLRAEKAEAALEALQALRGAAEDGADLEDLEGMVLSASHRAVEAASKTREVSSSHACPWCILCALMLRRGRAGRNRPGRLGQARQWTCWRGGSANPAAVPCH